MHRFPHRVIHMFGLRLRNEKELADQQLLATVRDLDQRMRILERDLDDLSTRYRRLRATQAAEARGAPTQPAASRGDDPEATEHPFDKNALRRKYLGKPVAT